MLPQAKPWIEAIDPYVPGKAKTGSGRPVAKLSSNESPLGPSPRAVAAMQAACIDAHRYPDASAAQLREALAAHHGLDPSCILCGTGSDEPLGLIALAYAGVGDEVVSVRHGFMVYPIAARRAGATPIEAADVDYTASVDTILSAVTQRTRVVYLANPNNPTGTVISSAEVARLHAGLPEHVILVLDGAYAEYIDAPDYESGLALAKVAPNVVATRTFSKIYGLASERVGWIYGAAPVINTLHRIRGPFNVTSSGLAGAVAALDDQDWIMQAKAHNDYWLPWVSRELQDLGLEVVPSVCNFVLFRFPESLGVTAGAANDYLMEAGYILRWLPNQGLGDCLRLTIGTEDENRGVLAALKDFLDHRS